MSHRSTENSLATVVSEPKSHAANANLNKQLEIASILSWMSGKETSAKKKEVASEGLWPIEPPVWANLFLTWHRDCLRPFISTAIIFFGIMMHYNTSFGIFLP